ncbi:MAG: hypothetical protein H6814_08650 [Phycisphaeraceae bacterium]|nr:hypothetical protein [Phycisphaeraceae bacterium]
MSVTTKLLRLYRVDCQVRSLRSRVDAAERYLRQQDKTLEDLTAKHEALSGQSRQLQATIGNDENEARSIEQRIEALREKLNNSTSNKEYSALLTEVNTLKADKSGVEERILESMTRLDEIKNAIAEIDAETAERGKVRTVALNDRDQRAAEVKDRLTELESERAVAAGDVPADALAKFEEEVEFREDEVMAPVSEHSRKHMEYACGSCQVLLPFEAVNRLLGDGELTFCGNCGAILFIEDELRELVTGGKK